MWKTIYNKFLDLIYPRRCAGCGLAHTYLCDECLTRAAPAEMENSAAQNWRALFTYEEPAIRRAIWLLKYRGAREVAEIFAAAMYENLAEDFSELRELYPRSGRLLLVPIPLSRRRLSERGYNQAALLAEKLADHDPHNLEFNDSLLIKIRHTAPQVALKNRAARLTNLTGAFQIKDKNQVAGRNIILIDDVITTGATVTEAARVLVAAGAGKIIAAAVAHG